MAYEKLLMYIASLSDKERELYKNLIEDALGKRQNSGGEFSHGQEKCREVRRKYGADRGSRPEIAGRPLDDKQGTAGIEEQVQDYFHCAHRQWPQYELRVRGGKFGP